MIRLLLTFCLIAITGFISAQCLSGDCEDGFGKIKFSDGTIYEGTFKNEIPHGLGIATYTNGTYYLGQFFESKFDGYGFLQNPDGQNFIGQWKNGTQEGEGVFTDAANNLTAGIWENGAFKNATSVESNPKNPSGCEGNCFDGYGRIMESKNMIQSFFKNGNATFGRIFNRAEYTYDGQIYNGLPDGYGQIRYNDGQHYFGYFIEGKKHGEGILSDNNQPRIYGSWKDDIYLPFDLVAFCNEMNTLSYVLMLEFVSIPEQDLNPLGHIIERKFLNQYDIVGEWVNTGEFTRELLFSIHFPKNNPLGQKITLEQINYALEACPVLTKIANSKFYYNDFQTYSVETYQPNSDVIIGMTFK